MTRTIRQHCLHLAIAAALFCPAPATAQVALDRPLRVFLDCNYCSSDFFTQEVPWVQFVRDRQDADVHVLVTQQTTAGGGSEFTLDFQGRAEFEGQRIALRTTTDSDATQDEERNALLAVVQQGLAPFAMSTTQQPRISVEPPDVPETAAPSAEDDPWNRWSFSVGVSGSMNGESQQKFSHSSGNLTASRITEDWKVRFRAGGSVSEQDFELPDGTTFESSTESYNGSGLVGRSLGPHWSVGGLSEWRRSTFSNYDHSVRVAPAIEFNYFPYGESTRRLLTAMYSVGPRYNDYGELTIFNEVEETLIEQELSLSYDVTQPWGNIDASITGTHYITKFGDGDDWVDPQYNLGMFGGFRLRLFKGLQANLNGSITMVRGQIQLRRGDADPNEVLTRQKELATNFRYFTFFGLSYRFGSIFTTVVNPRFNDFF